MKKDIHNQNTGHDIGTLMSSYGIRAQSVGHLLKFIEDMEALVMENEKAAYSRGFNDCLNTQLNNEI